MTDAHRHLIDWSAAFISFAALLDIAPKVAACMSISWMVYRFATWLRHHWRKWRGQGGA